MEITIRAGFNTGPQSQDHPGLLDREHGRILDSSRLVAVFSGWPTGLLHLKRFAEKNLVEPHANVAVLRASITREWGRLLAANVCKTCSSFRCRLKQSLRKW
jgi:hypothetical protein